ncbi:co-chaperonin GroES-like [Aethina tumida]|uniref:co-chaperonin GroES-like n=1 Tax=Aethina tumida TaxID=116153 RepID=UPI00096B3112|nr:co-chaperonin GroES-like [Aethina tumida]
MAAVPKHAASTFNKIMPLFNRVLVRKRITTETEGGIVLPDNVKEKYFKGVVMAVGPGSYRDNGKQIPVVVQPGDNVLLPEYGGTKVEIDGEKLFLYRENDILAKISF